jgi:hypothetical protein
MTQPIDLAAVLERQRQEQAQFNAEMDAITAELKAAIPNDLSGLAARARVLVRCRTLGLECNRLLLAARARVLVRWLQSSPSADDDVRGLAESLAEGLAALVEGRPFRVQATGASPPAGGRDSRTSL